MTVTVQLLCVAPVTILLSIVKMEFPPAWDFMTPGDAASFDFAPDRPLAMATLLDFDGGAAGAFRIILGGTQLVEVSFCAALLFGAEFDGEPFPSSTLGRLNL